MNPWVNLTKKDMQEIGTIYSPEEISYYKDRGYMPPSMESDIRDLDINLPIQVDWRKRVDSAKETYRPKKAAVQRPISVESKGIWDEISKTSSKNNSVPANDTRDIGRVKEVAKKEREEVAEVRSIESGSVFSGIENVEAIDPDNFKKMLNEEMSRLNLTNEDRAMYWGVMKGQPDFTNIQKLEVLKNLLLLNEQDQNQESRDDVINAEEIKVGR